MHQNARFNIIQAEGNCRAEFVVIDGQRLDSGHPAAGARVVSAPMSRDKAIERADELEQGTSMRLIYEATGQLVTVGDTVDLGGGRTDKVKAFPKPHKPDSEGRVDLESGACYYVGVIGAKWINRGDE